VIARDAYLQVGSFDDSVGAATDLDMWSRMFAAFGACLEPVPIVAYVVHPAAGTERMFTDEYVTVIAEVFDRAVGLGVLPEPAIRQAQAHWYNQFVIAGTVRRVRARDWQGAQDVARLFDNEAMAGLPTSRRWRPLRTAVKLSTHVTRRAARDATSDHA
jgi:hypothetical protein